MGSGSWPRSGGGGEPVDSGRVGEPEGSGGGGGAVCSFGGVLVMRSVSW